MITVNLFPKPPKHLRSLYATHLNRVKKILKEHAKSYNDHLAKSPKKYHFQKCYRETTERIVDLFGWQFNTGNLRSDGYFFTTKAGLATYKIDYSTDTVDRHLKRLKAWGIIKDIDKETPGLTNTQRRYRHGFWIRLADWIIDLLLEDVKLELYEAKKEVLDQAHLSETIPLEENQLIQSELVKENTLNSRERTKQEVDLLMMRRKKVNSFSDLMYDLLSGYDKIGSAGKPAPT